MDLYEVENDSQKWKLLFAISLVLNIIFVGLFLIADGEEKTAVIAPPEVEDVAPATVEDKEVEEPGTSLPQAQPQVELEDVSTLDAPYESESSHVDEKGRHYFCGEVHGSLIGTFQREMEEMEANWLAAHVRRILMWSMNTQRDLIKGDRIRVLYEFDGSLDGMSILAMNFNGHKAKKVRAVRFQASDDPFPKYFDPEGTEIEKRLKNSPVSIYQQVTDLLGGLRRHKGIDFKAPLGTDVVAPFPGKILRKNFNWKTNGNCLELNFPGKGIKGYFLHMDKFDDSIKPGVTVKAGQKIGIVGNTGRTTSAHLHYQLMKNGRVIDPLKFHKVCRKSLSGEELLQFQRKTEPLFEALDSIDCK